MVAPLTDQNRNRFTEILCIDPSADIKFSIYTWQFYVTTGISERVGDILSGISGYHASDPNTAVEACWSRMRRAKMLVTDDEKEEPQYWCILGEHLIRIRGTRSR